MDGHSYIAGFVQGLIACEMLVLLIKMVIEAHRSKKDMEQLDMMGKQLETDLIWSKTVADAYVKTNERLDKIVEKLGIEEEDDEDEQEYNS